MKLFVSLMILFSFSFSIKLNDESGFVLDKYGNFINKKYRTYEYEGLEWPGGYYCIQAAGATAVGIRVGEKLSVRKVSKYLKGLYGKRNNYEPSMNDWINASNKFHIPQLKVEAEKIDNMDDLYKIVKNAIDNNFLVTILLRNYIISSLDKKLLIKTFQDFGILKIFSFLYYHSNPYWYYWYKLWSAKIPILDDMRGGINHSVTIVGYIKYGNEIYYAIRDPFLTEKKAEGNNTAFYDYFDYLVGENVLENEIIFGNTLLIFKTKDNKRNIIVKKFSD